MSKDKIDKAKKDIECAAEDAKKVIAEAADKARRVIIDSNNNKGFMDILYKQVSLGMSVLSLFGLVIGVFIFLTKPSNDNDTALKLQDARITAQREIIDTLTKTSQNDTIEVKEAIKDLVGQINTLNTEVATLTAIINERIPAKK